MIFLSNIYTDRKILSLRTGGPIGHAQTPIINPSNLKIDGWYATAAGNRETMILPAQEVRDLISKGIVVNDHDAITPLEDMVRLKSVIDEAYELIGALVYSENGEKLGKVKDYAVDNKSMFIKKLYVNQTIFRSISHFTRPQTIIDRAQIIDVTKHKIVVKDTTIKAPVNKTATARAQA